MKKIFYIMLLGVMVIASCKKDDDKVPGTAMKEMAGEWFLRYSTDGGQTWGDYTHFSTYNTANNSTTEMWLDDLETFWEMKGKVNVDLNNKTFSGANVANQYYESTFTITEGKLVVKGTTAPASGTVTDLLTFKVKFSDDDDNLEYLFSGYRKTGFLEDEH